MTVAEELIKSIELRWEGFDLFGVGTESNEPWSYELDEPSLFLHTLRGDVDDIRRAESVTKKNELWEQIRPLALAFHIGGLN